MNLPVNVNSVATLSASGIRSESTEQQIVMPEQALYVRRILFSLGRNMVFKFPTRFVDWKLAKKKLRLSISNHGNYASVVLSGSSLVASPTLSSSLVLSSLRDALRADASAEGFSVGKRIKNCQRVKKSLKLSGHSPNCSRICRRNPGRRCSVDFAGSDFSSSIAPLFGNWFRRHARKINPIVPRT